MEGTSGAVLDTSDCFAEQAIAVRVRAVYSSGRAAHLGSGFAGGHTLDTVLSPATFCSTMWSMQASCEAKQAERLWLLFRK